MGLIVNGVSFYLLYWVVNQRLFFRMEKRKEKMKKSSVEEVETAVAVEQVTEVKNQVVMAVMEVEEGKKGEQMQDWLYVITSKALQMGT